MCLGSKCVTPFTKQCFVTAGVSLNLMSHGLVIGFGSVLLPELKRTQIVPIDDDSASWIASIVGFALIAGTFVVPTVMTQFGRKVVNLTAALIMTFSWFYIILANSITSFLVARFLQGFSMGLTASLCSILIGEYTSPKNRGAFLTTISVAIGFGVLVIHALGSLLSWQKTALACAFIAFLDVIIIIYSPESPSFLASKGKYEECRRIFHWLRGYNENDELEKMIKTDILVKENNNAKPKSIIQTLSDKLRYFSAIVRKREFYKPIILMIHLFTLNQWSGPNIISTYTTDVFNTIIGSEANIHFLILTMDVQRIVSNTAAIFVIKKARRRPVLLITTSINIISYLLIAAYVFCKENGLLPFDHPLIGTLLIHLQMFSIATGTISLPNIIAGEVFPLEYKGIGGMITVLFLSLNLFVTIKTWPFLLTKIGFYGVYCLNAGVVAYSLIVSLLILPETKDRTLQDIEEEFRGGPITQNMKSSLSVSSFKFVDVNSSCPSRI